LWDNLSDTSSSLTPWPFRMGPACPEMSVRNYNSTLRNIAEERRSQKWNTVCIQAPM
jgi:hypothetical protein